ncbi:MAG: Hsp20/alpha crystallin family protein [Microvirga sp.]
MAEPTQSGSGRADLEPEQGNPEQKRPVEQQGGEPTHSRRTFRPSVDIYEIEDGLMLLADVPGATPDGVTITLERRALIVHARVADHAPEGYSLVYQEYEVGDFACEFNLAGEFDAEKIEAGLTDGVLRLSVPKAAQAEARVIRVTAGT